MNIEIIIDVVTLKTISLERTTLFVKYINPINITENINPIKTL